MSEGAKCTVEQCAEWLDQLDREFPDTVIFLEGQRQKVYDQGFIVTPYGRIKHLYEMEDHGAQAAQEREAINFSIQSTVGDLLRAAMLKFQQVRDEVGIQAWLCPDLHDAMYAYCVGSDVRLLIEKVLPAALGTAIPGLNLVLDYEVSLYCRWGEEPTENALIARGVSPEVAQKYSSL